MSGFEKSGRKKVNWEVAEVVVGRELGVTADNQSSVLKWWKWTAIRWLYNILTILKPA